MKDRRLYEDLSSETANYRKNTCQLAVSNLLRKGQGRKMVS